MATGLFMTAMSKWFDRHRTTATLWGDGFEDDSFSSIVGPANWDDVCDDELLRFYPRLPGEGGPRLVDHLEHCVVTLCVQAFGATPPTLRAVPADHIRSLAATRKAGWSPAPTKAYLERFSAREIHELDDLLWQLRTGSLAPFERERAELVALHGGIHPAYFWPTTIQSHQRFTTFGWLGVVMRGRSALMPLEVAEYLCEIGEDWGSDPHLASRFGSERVAASYVRQAIRRLKGHEIVVPGAFRPRLAIFGGCA